MPARAACSACLQLTVELLNATGDLLRHIPAAMAKQLVTSGAAEVHNQNGKVKSVRLLERAATHCWRIGQPTVPTGPPAGRFVRRIWLEQSGARVYEHHPRCTWE